MNIGVKTVLERESILTPAGYTKLKAELNMLKTVKRKEVTDKIREALEFGDPWGNPEYESAKREQAFIEGRIKTLENLLNNARVVTSPKNSDVVGLGSVVQVLDLETGEEYVYTIVGSGEADPKCNRISYKSPVAQAMLGHKGGDCVQARCPIGEIGLKILNVMNKASREVDEEVG
ncbi:MAG: transcription elongation factor GreA [Firmicutes bacterium]|nr:transcription elongation factor GreA [Bacillota bacterium]